MHLLVDINPALEISVLFNNLKTASACRARNRLTEHYAAFYKKPHLPHNTCFVSSVGNVGNAAPATVRVCVDAQGTREHSRNAVAKAIQNQSPCLPPPVRLA